MHKHGIYANYTVCASVFIHSVMQRKNNENIPIISLNLNNASHCTVEVIFEYHFTWTMPATILLKLSLNITLPEQCQPLHCWSYLWISLYLNNASHHTVEVVFEYHFTWTMPATILLKLSLNITLPEQCQPLHCWSYLWISLLLFCHFWHQSELTITPIIKAFPL